MCKSTCSPAFRPPRVLCTEKLPFLECMDKCRESVFNPGECHLKYCSVPKTISAHQCPADCLPENCMDFVEHLSDNLGLTVDMSVKDCVEFAASYSHGLYDDPSGKAPDGVASG